MRICPGLCDQRENRTDRPIFISLFDYRPGLLLQVDGDDGLSGQPRFRSFVDAVCSADGWLVGLGLALLLAREAGSTISEW